MKDRKFDQYSYASANVFPLKLLLHEDLIHSCIHEKKVIPIHIQLNPTNKCIFDCSFCSCSNRDRRLELPYPELISFMEKAKELGCKSVTITGGGEPLLYPKFDEMVTALNELGIEMGLVTNGALLDAISDGSISKMTWIRISVSDEMPEQLERHLGLSFDRWLKVLSNIVKNNRRVDWAFSYVVTENSKPELIAKILKFANEHNFTHIRLVNDIFRADQLKPVMEYIKWAIRTIYKIDDRIVNYQDRAYWTKGQNPCYISLLKPVVDAGGYILPCCGTMYALEKPSRDYEPSMRMGHIRDFEDLIHEQKFFDGSRCVKCYYYGYNLVLGTLLKGLKHVNFV